jgi:hypothetical protein
VVRVVVVHRRRPPANHRDPPGIGTLDKRADRFSLVGAG